MGNDQKSHRLFRDKSTLRTWFRAGLLKRDIHLLQHRDRIAGTNSTEIKLQ